MEIERKFLIDTLPKELSSHPCRHMEQGYLCTSPVVRVRKSDDSYYLTYKGSGMMMREEYNLPLTAESYAHLIQKADGNIITKTRYLIPIDGGLTAELDVFSGKFAGLKIVEVEFTSKEEAGRFNPPDWFGREVTYDGRFHNSYLSSVK